MASPIVRIAQVGPVYLRMMTFRPGDVVLGHAHTYDHISQLSQGSVEATVNGVTKDFTAPVLIFVEKELEHSFRAGSDGAVLTCIHALRNGDEQGTLIDDDMTLSSEQTQRAIGRLTV